MSLLVLGSVWTVTTGPASRPPANKLNSVFVFEIETWLECRWGMKHLDGSRTMFIDGDRCLGVNTVSGHWQAVLILILLTMPSWFYRSVLVKLRKSFLRSSGNTAEHSCKHRYFMSNHWYQISIPSNIVPASERCGGSLLVWTPPAPITGSVPLYLALPVNFVLIPGVSLAN